MKRVGKPRHRWATRKGEGAGAKESIVRVRLSCWRFSERNFTFGLLRLLNVFFGPAPTLQRFNGFTSPKVKC